MAIETQKYIRRPLYVDAVRITSGNFEEISSWCQGEILQEEVPGKGTTKQFIKVRVVNPKNPRQTKAFVGDWLLYTDKGYKVYTNKAFHASFNLVEAEVVEAPVPVLSTSEANGEGSQQNGQHQEKRVLTYEEQVKMGPEEVNALIQSGEAVLVQDTAQV